MIYNVFYPQDLLDELFKHIFYNGIQKKIGDAKPEVIFKLKEDTDEHIVLLITYDNTDPNTNKGDGTGLRKHKEIIEKFDGFCDYDPNAKNEFFIEIKLVKYD